MFYAIIIILLIVILVPATFVTVVFGGMPRPNTLWLTTMPVALVTVIIFELKVVVAVVVIITIVVAAIVVTIEVLTLLNLRHAGAKRWHTDPIQSHTPGKDRTSKRASGGACF